MEYIINTRNGIQRVTTKEFFMLRYRSLMSNNYVWVYFESDKVRVEESNEGVNVRHVEPVQYTI